jgi:hypothetical protein
MKANAASEPRLALDRKLCLFVISTPSPWVARHFCVARVILKDTTAPSLEAGGP